MAFIKISSTPIVSPKQPSSSTSKSSINLNMPKASIFSKSSRPALGMGGASIHSKTFAKSCSPRFKIKTKRRGRMSLDSIKPKCQGSHHSLIFSRSACTGCSCPSLPRQASTEGNSSCTKSPDKLMKEDTLGSPSEAISASKYKLQCCKSWRLQVANSLA